MASDATEPSASGNTAGGEDAAVPTGCTTCGTAVTLPPCTPADVQGPPVAHALVAPELLQTPVVDAAAPGSSPVERPAGHEVVVDGGVGGTPASPRQPALAPAPDISDTAPRKVASGQLGPDTAGLPPPCASLSMSTAPGDNWFAPMPRGPVRIQVDCDVWSVGAADRPPTRRWPLQLVTSCGASGSGTRLGR